MPPIAGVISFVSIDSVFDWIAVTGVMVLVVYGRCFTLGGIPTSGFGPLEQRRRRCMVFCWVPGGTFGPMSAPLGPVGSVTGGPTMAGTVLVPYVPLNVTAGLDYSQVPTGAAGTGPGPGTMLDTCRVPVVESGSF